MPVDLKLPLLGDVMQEGTLATWLKEDGAEVQRGEPLYQLETDKVNYAVEAPANGYLRQIVAAGETVAVGTLVGQVVEETGGSAGPATERTAGSAGTATGRTAGNAGTVTERPGGSPEPAVEE